jgi:hypothetical protein
MTHVTFIHSFMLHLTWIETRVLGATMQFIRPHGNPAPLELCCWSLVAGNLSVTDQGWVTYCTIPPL